jgi:cyclic pyranopterin phosphate synthase
VRLTGGEPLLRRGLPDLIERLARKAAIRDLAMTTNAVLLSAHAADLRKAGLHRLTISLDTLQRERFIKLARYDELPRVLAGIDSAIDPFPGFKIDSVIIRGVNDDEIIPLLEFAKERGAEIRFIEYMDVGGATAWSMSQVLSRTEMLETIAAHYGPVEPLREDSSAPADRYQLPDGTIFGIIASTTEPFCRTCDRSRLTADGVWYLCLYATRGVDLRGPLRGGVGDDTLRELITSVWHARTDRGAENRLSVRERSPLIPLQALKRDPHLEMHTRGG